MFINLKKLLFFLTPKERQQLPFLLIMILIMAILDMIGVASIMPFMTVLTNPELVENNFILNKMYEFSEIFGVKNNEDFLFMLGVLVLVLLVFSLTFKALTTYLLARFTYMREYSISKLLVERYLHQPYSWFLNRNSSELGKTILDEVGNVINGGIRPMIDLAAHSAIVFAILTLLILVDVKIALSVFLIVGAAYSSIYFLTRGFINRLGEKRLKVNELRFISIAEAFGVIKELKVSGLEKPYIRRFADPAKKMAKFHASFYLLNHLPRYALEIVAFGGMMLLVLYLMSQTVTFINILPLISLYALAAYRLMPAIQKIYNSVALLRYVGPAIDSIFNDVKSLKLIDHQSEQDTLSLKFSDKISLKKINFNYPNASRTALKNINLDILYNTTVGFVGTTGSGKTTTVDIILGLLEPQQGTLEVDGKKINLTNYKSWQKIIGYVPQNIYLSDDTISSNIALGVDKKDIDQEAVERAAKIANIHDFIVNELPNSYKAIAGERGIRLSGGQRQRIGIARALYHKPKVLIFDEATSSLDNVTEQAVMEAVNKLENDVTIILIAHRLSTLKKCDIIFQLENGVLKNKGTYKELIQLNNNSQGSVNNI